MRKIKKISLALIILQLLQTGCMQDKISKIEPSKSENDKNITRSSNGAKKKIILTQNINKQDNQEELIIGEESYENSDIEIYTNENDSDLIVSEEPYIETYTNELTALIQYQNDSCPEETSPLVTIDNSWQELTKEEEIIETAKTFIGTKYVWAANGPESFDCSGFTKYVYKQSGINLPRYSGHQAKVGIEVTYDELQKGDLVFFDTEHKFMGRVNHVGIYIGNNKFIHASSAKKKVVITSFNEKPFYKRRFLRGERVIDYISAYASL